MTGFEIYFPSEIFERYPEYGKDLESFIFTPSEFLIETLEIFGLPKNYMKGEGHWKDWAEKIQQNLRAAQLRRPKKQPKKTEKKKAKDSKKEDEQKPPSHFDVEPFRQAFGKFIMVSAELRTIFRSDIKQKSKSVVMLFCDENGQMIDDKTVDLNNLGKKMNDNGVSINPSVSQNMSSLLHAFGDIVYEERVVQVQIKEEEKKNISIKKENVVKFMDVTQRLVSYQDFEGAVQTMARFDTQLAKLGYIKGVKL